MNKINVNYQPLVIDYKQSFRVANSNFASICDAINNIQGLVQAKTNPLINGLIGHNTLTGLSADDHPQYAKALHGVDLNYAVFADTATTFKKSSIITDASGNIGIKTTTLTHEFNLAGTGFFNLNTVAGPAGLANTVIRAQGADNAQSRIGLSTFGIAGFGAFATRHARGTAASPSAVQTGDIIGSFESWGYGATGFSVAPRSFMRHYAAENWTNSAQGSYIAFWTTPKTGIVPSEKVRIADDGNVGIGTATLPTTSRLTIEDVYRSPGNWGNITVRSSDAHAINRGGYIVLSGKYNSGSEFMDFAGIGGRKENDTDGNKAGYLQFCTATAGAAGASEKMRLDSTGALCLGGTNPLVKFDVRGIASGSDIALSRANGTGSTDVASGNSLGSIQWQGMGSSSFRKAAYIECIVASTPTLDTTPGHIDFATTQAGTSQNPIVRMRLQSNGYLAVGGTAASEILDVNGNLIIQSGNILKFNSANTFVNAYDCAGASPAGPLYSLKIGAYMRVSFFAGGCDSGGSTASTPSVEVDKAGLIVYSKINFGSYASSNVNYISYSTNVLTIRTSDQIRMESAGFTTTGVVRWNSGTTNLSATGLIVNADFGNLGTSGTVPKFAATGLADSTITIDANGSVKIKSTFTITDTNDILHIGSAATAVQRVHIDAKDYSILTFDHASTSKWLIALNYPGGIDELSFFDVTNNVTRAKLTQAGNFGVGNIVPEIMIDTNNQVGMTNEGGLAIRVYNNTGSTLTRGYIAAVAGTGTKYVKHCPAGGDCPLGVIYQDITTGNYGWLVVSGLAYVKFVASVTQTGYADSYVVTMSTGTDGLADQYAVASVTSHWREIGHALQSVSNSALVLCTLHFN